MGPEAALDRLLARQAVEEVLYRYASSIDSQDYETLRTLFTRDATARYGARDWMSGGDRIVDWIIENSQHQRWQHHQLNVYHVDLAGDAATALTYVTSHQVGDDPDRVSHIVSRYRDELRRTDGEWRIARKEMEVGWREVRRRADAP